MLRRMALFLLIGCMAAGGCATMKSEKAFESASMGMSKADVIKKVGSPAVIRGAIRNEAGEKVDVWEYRVGKAKSFEQVTTESFFTAMTAGAGAPILLSSADRDNYWFYFVDGKFAGWGRAGDWGRDGEKIRGMTFKPGKDISLTIAPLKEK
ncbi:MAG: hypothetical protein PHT32_02830 [Candidatus Omnitrophica bacterium]|nr:hypothetical protein [Candidatus Omnitrophota bacterium]